MTDSQKTINNVNIGDSINVISASSYKESYRPKLPAIGIVKEINTEIPYVVAEINGIEYELYEYEFEKHESLKI